MGRGGWGGGEGSWGGSMFSNSPVTLTNGHGHLKSVYELRTGRLENLKQLFGKNAPSTTHVIFWFGEFRRWCSFDDAHRCGTPATAVTNSDAAEKLIRAEPKVTTRASSRVQESLSIGTAATMSIWHDHLVSENDLQGGSPTR